MNGRFAILAAVSLTLLAPARAEEPLFPLMAWGHAPGDPAVLKTMRECGITVAGFVEPRALDACRDAGLKAIVSDPRASNYDWKNVDPAAARANIEALTREVKDHPAVYGYYLRDEPTADLFGGLATVAAAVKEFHPGAWPYINLYPNYADMGQLGAPDYDSHIKSFVEICKPTALSYDHYAPFEDGTLREGYFANLESMRKAALEHDLPFWNIILTAAHFNYREPNDADIRFQMYTSLAYGARGIAFFTYFTPKHGNYRLGPIDQFGHKTPTWDKLRMVNLQVAQLGPTLLKLRSDRVYHFGDIPRGAQDPPADSLVEAIDGPMLVGEFTHEDGSRHLLIVNKSFTASAPCRPKLRTEATLEQVSPYTGQVQPFGGEGVWLAPGQGALLRIAR